MTLKACISSLPRYIGYKYTVHSCISYGLDFCIYAIECFLVRYLRCAPFKIYKKYKIYIYQGESQIGGRKRDFRLRSVQCETNCSKNIKFLFIYTVLYVAPAKNYSVACCSGFPTSKDSVVLFIFDEGFANPSELSQTFSKLEEKLLPCCLTLFGDPATTEGRCLAFHCNAVVCVCGGEGGVGETVSRRITVSLSNTPKKKEKMTDANLLFATTFGQQ